MSGQANILYGKELAQKYLKKARQEIFSLNKHPGVHPISLATLRIGNPQDSILYENHLKKLLQGVGIRFIPGIYRENISEREVTQVIGKLAKNSAVTGIMLFSPLPKKISHANVFEAMPLNKDVEGRTFLKNHFGIFSPTANAVMELIDSAGGDLAGKEAVVVGHSDLVGKPTAALLMDRHCTVTVCQKETKDLRSHVQRADILVSAVGKPHLIPGRWIKRGSVVIDVGENNYKGKIVGDVDYEAASKRAAHLTPVPGGVGPLTNVMLIKNLIQLYKRQQRRNGNY